MKLTLIFFLTYFTAYSQIPMSFGFGDTFKNGNGSMYLSIGYKPIKQVEFFIAPSGGLFFGGLAMFYGAKVRILSKFKLYPNIELTYRHSNKRGISYENHESKETENFWAPSADYIVTGIGLNYKLKPQDNYKECIVINLSGNYSYSTGNYQIKNIKGPFSSSGQKSAQSTLNGGYGFSISAFMDIELFMKKKNNTDAN